MLVDTGSSEFWCNPDCSNVQLSLQDQCQYFGQYNPDNSETPPFGPFGSEKINYGDASDPSTHTSATIIYYADTMSFGDAEIKNQTFGMVTQSDGISQGIMGLAPDTTYGFDSSQPYSLVLNTMAEQDIIGSRLFALDLRHSDSETGAVIFGGLDRNKFIGKLESVPIIKGDRGEYRLGVRLSSIGISTSSSQDEHALNNNDTSVMLDSGTTLTRLHYSAAYHILEALEAEDDGEGYYITKCTWRNKAGSFDFGFGNKIIRVPFSDMILDVGHDVYCYVGVVITTDQQILGDTVLRAGYFVFDWDNRAVHIGQAANCGDDDIVAIDSADKNVADVTGNCKQSDAKVTGIPNVSVHAITKARSTVANLILQASITGTAILPTKAYTTTYTITTCPLFDLDCKTGVVTTKTIEPAQATVTVTGTAGGDGGGDDDSAGIRPSAFTWVLVLFGVLTMVFNAA